MHEGKVLIVRHGPGRGRLVRYCQHVLDHLAKARPQLRERIQVHETGTGRPNLEGVRAVVFWLGDPLGALYPACYVESLGIAREARARGLRLVNPPEILANYSKNWQSSAWREAGLPTPGGVTFSNHAEFQELSERLEYPVIIRGDIVHSREGAHVLSSARQALEIPAGDLPLPGIASRLIDVRMGYRAKAPLSIWARLYHLKRVIVLGDIVIPEGLRFAREPIITTSNSTYGRFVARRDRLRASLPAGHRRGVLQRALKKSPYLHRSITADGEFVTGGMDHPDVFLRAARVLGLDFLAFDYATLASGEVVLWEANPYPQLTPANGFLLAAERRTHERMLLAYGAFATFFDTLSAHEPAVLSEAERVYRKVS